MNPDSEVQGCPESVLGFVTQICSSARRKCWLLRSQNRLNLEKIGISRVFLWMGHGYIHVIGNSRRPKKASQCSEYRNSGGHGTEGKDQRCLQSVSPGGGMQV
jgi:hypothetical protein